MPESVTYRVQTYYKLAKGETGITNVSSRRLDAAAALSWILADLDSEECEAYAVTHEDSGEPGLNVVTVKIDWSKVPDSVRNPKFPTRNGRRL